MSALRTLVRETAAILEAPRRGYFGPKKSKDQLASQAFVNALSVARGRIPAYQHPLERLHYVEEALASLERNSKKLKLSFGDDLYAQLVGIFKKYNKLITAVEAARQASVEAEGAVTELDADSTKLAQMLWEVE
jgi:hypothetical protein